MIGKPSRYLPLGLNTPYFPWDYLYYFFKKKLYLAFTYHYKYGLEIALHGMLETLDTCVVYRKLPLLFISLYPVLSEVLNYTITLWDVVGRYSNGR